MENLANNDTQKASPNRQSNKKKKEQDLLKIKKQKIQEVLAMLKKQFPLAFKENPEPLKIGVLEELVDKLNDKISKNKIRGALKYYTQNLMYHQAVLINTCRIDLAGNDANLLPHNKKNIRKSAWAKFWQKLNNDINSNLVIFLIWEKGYESKKD